MSDVLLTRQAEFDELCSQIRDAGVVAFDTEVVDCLLSLSRAGGFALIPSPSSEDLELLKGRPSGTHS